MNKSRLQPVIAAATAVALLLVLGASCGDDDDDDSGGGGGAAPTAEDLDGRTFVSSTVEGQTLVDGTEVTLSFESDSISVNAGCNTMNGGYEIDDSTLQVGELAQTLMACEDELMAQDGWIAELLGSDPQIALDGDTLTLTGEGATITATA